MTQESELSNDEKMWGMICHLSALAGLIIPFGNIIAPLIVWMIKKNEMPFVDEQGKESLNFQITTTVIMFVAIVVAIVLTFVVIGFLLLPLIGLAGLGLLIYVVIGGIKANNGEHFQYAFNIRLIK